MKRKKICFLTTISTTMNMFILNTAKYLYKNGNYDITMICSNDDEFKLKVPEYIKFVPIEMKRGISFSGIKNIIELYEIFKNEKFDMIQYSTPNAALYASIAGRLAKVKVRLYCQWGIRYVGFTGIKRKIFKFIEKITCRNSTWIEPDSYGNLRFSREEGLYAEKNSSVVWYGSASGIDLRKFDVRSKEKWNNEIRKKYSIADKEVILGFIGRLDKDKGINELLEAFKQINNKNIKLFIVGPSDKPETMNKELYKWAKENENVIFIGRVNEVEKYYAVMDIFALPSYREGFGSVVIEAESMKVPVIVTDIPGPTDAMLKDETGLIVKKADADSLKNAIEDLMQNKEKRDKMANKGYIFATEKFEDTKLFGHILEDRNRLLE